MNTTEKDMLTAIVIVAMVCATLLIGLYRLTAPRAEPTLLGSDMTLVEKVDAINQRLQEQGFTGIEVKVLPKP